MPTSRPLTTREVASKLKVHRRTVGRWVQRGELVPLQHLPGLTGTYLFDPAEIDAMADAKATGTTR